MRLRNVPGSRDTIAESPFTIKDETEKKGKWNEVFGNDNPIHIEIGMGKGRFLMQLASQNPDINYIGIEQVETVLAIALKKIIDKELEEDPKHRELINYITPSSILDYLDNPIIFYDDKKSIEKGFELFMKLTEEINLPFKIVFDN